MLWQAVLTRLGYEVVTYTDSVEALQVFRLHPSASIWSLRIRVCRG